MDLAFIGPAGFGAPELVLILLVLLLLFGAKKLPEVARGSGRALRIFKAETKGLHNDDEDASQPPSAGAYQPPVQPQALTPPEPVTPPRPVEEPYRSDPDR